MQLNLTPKQATLVVAALSAVSPAGGGSDSHYLAHLLSRQAGVDMSSDAFNNLVFSLVQNVVTD